MRQVLLIDDNPIQLRTREAVLRAAGFAVTVATTAESAMALLSTDALADNIGLIVTDHLLPGATGADFVRQLRPSHPDLPVLVLSGMAEAEEEYDGLDVTFRQKPLAPPDLIAAAKCLFRHRQAA